MKNRYIKTDAIKDKISANKIDLPINKGDGQNSIIQMGSNNSAIGSNSFAEGNNTKASGYCSHTEGVRTTASNDCSHAEGIESVSSGAYSHAEGHYTRALSFNEHAEGQYNISIKDKTIHTVGIGSNNASRANAHEIHKDGKHYIFGIGGYDGTNSQTEGIKTLQEVITELETRIVALENIISQTAVQE